MSNKSSFFRELLAGYGSGMMSILVGYPLDTIKVHQQVYGQGAVKSITKIYRQRGLSGFYQGMLMPMLTYGALTAIVFSVYNSTLQVFATMNHERINPDQEIEDVSSYREIFVAGSVGGFSQALFSTSTEIIKLQMQVAKRPCSMMDVIKVIYKEKGIKGFTRGGLMTILRETGPQGVYICTYKYFADLSKENARNRGETRVNYFETFLAGAGAGMCYWWTSIPFDTIKSRMQSDSIHNPRYKTNWDVIRHIAKTQGIKGFYRGIGITTLTAIPIDGMSYVFYELCRQFYDLVFT